MLIGTNQQMGISDAFYKGDYLTIIRQLENLTHVLDFVDYNLLSVYSDYVDDIKRGFANGDCEDVAALLHAIIHALRFNSEQMLEYADYLEESNKHLQRNCKDIQKELDAVY